LDARGAQSYGAALQGWCSPLNGARPYREMSIRFSITLEHSGNTNQFASVILTANDLPFEDEERSPLALSGHRFVVRGDGTMSIEKYSGSGQPTVVARKLGRPLKPGESAAFGITYQRGKLEFWNFAQRLIVDAVVDAPPGYYVSFGARGLRADFSGVTVTAL
jgi:hypothetical protein